MAWQQAGGSQRQSLAQQPSPSVNLAQGEKQR